MKKLFRRLLPLTLALAMLLSMSAFAADIHENDYGKITNVITGATATFDATIGEKILVTYTSETLVPDGQYLVLMIAGESGAAATEESIKYINQTQATTDATPSVSFEVYPSELVDGTIVIAGVGTDGNKYIEAVIVEGTFMLGDVNFDGRIMMIDAMLIIRQIAGIQPLSEKQFKPADVNCDGRIMMIDAMRIIRLVAKITTEL